MKTTNETTMKRRTPSAREIALQKKVTGLEKRLAERQKSLIEIQEKLDALQEVFDKLEVKNPPGEYRKVNAAALRDGVRRV